jgi:hypothetical protein
MKLRPPNSAPKDGTVFLGEFGWPWLVTTAWNEHDGKWVYAYLQEDHMSDGKTDLWFENEQESERDLKGWMPMPRCAK